MPGTGEGRDHTVPRPALLLRYTPPYTCPARERRTRCFVAHIAGCLRGAFIFVRGKNGPETNADDPIGDGGSNGAMPVRRRGVSADFSHSTSPAGAAGSRRPCPAHASYRYLSHADDLLECSRSFEQHGRDGRRGVVGVVCGDRGARAKVGFPPWGGRGERGRAR